MCRATVALIKSFLVVVTVVVCLTHLITATVPRIAERQLFQPVHVEEATISHIYHNAFITATVISVKANFSCNNAFVNCRMTSFHPSCQVCVTSVSWYTAGRHFCPCATGKSVPAFGQIFITFPRIVVVLILVPIGPIEKLVLKTLRDN